MDDALSNLIKTELITAARAITRSWGGVIPEQPDKLWSETLTTLAAHP